MVGNGKSYSGAAESARCGSNQHLWTETRTSAENTAEVRHSLCHRRLPGTAFPRRSRRGHNQFTPWSSLCPCRGGPGKGSCGCVREAHDAESVGSEASRRVGGRERRAVPDSLWVEFLQAGGVGKKSNRRWRGRRNRTCTLPYGQSTPRSS